MENVCNIKEGPFLTQLLDFNYSNKCIFTPADVRSGRYQRSDDVLILTQPTVSFFLFCWPHGSGQWIASHFVALRKVLHAVRIFTAHHCNAVM